MPLSFDFIADVPAPALVGRSVALGRLVATMERAPDEPAGLVMVTGEAGIGKSRLFDEALTMAPSAFLVLRGRAEAVERGIPYNALSHAVASAVSGADDVSATTLQALVALLDVEPTTDPWDIESRLGQVHSRAARLLDQLCEHRPVLLAIDDLHNADDDTIVLLETLLRGRLRSRPLLVLTTVRTSVPEPLESLDRLDGLRRPDGSPLLDRIDLEPLPSSDLFELLSSVLVDVVPHEDLAEFVTTQSRGNPFFAIETLRSLADAGLVTVAEGVASIDGEAPVRLIRRRSALLRRVFPLGKDARAIARAMSAFSRIRLEDLPLIAEVVALPEATVAGAFDRLVRAAVLRRSEDDSYVFTHAIVGDTLYTDLGPAERRRLHASIADRLRADRARGARVDMFEIARHVVESAEPGDRAGVAALREAGDAVVRTAPRSASAWYEHALALLDDGDHDRHDLLARHALALHGASRTAEAVRVGQGALAVMGASPNRRRVTAIVAEGLGAMGDHEGALDLADAELAASGAEVRLLTLRAAELERLGCNDHAITAARAALGLAVSTCDRVLARLQMAQLSAADGDVDELRNLVDRDLQTLNDLSPHARLLIFTWASQQLSHEALVEDARALLDQAAELQSSVGGLNNLGPFAVARLTLDWLEGRWVEGLARGVEALGELRRQHQMTYAAQVASLLTEIATQRGDVRLARTFVDEPQTDSVLVRQLNAVARAGFDAEVGDLAAARAQLERSLEVDARIRFHYMAQARLAEVALAQGDRALADSLVSDLLAGMGKPHRPRFDVYALLAASVVRDDAEAAARAREIAQEVGLPFFRAQADLVLGRLGIEPEQHLRGAHEAFRLLGAEPWRRRVVAELRRRKLPLPRRARDHGELSDSEAQIAALVQQGFRNREIAEQLAYSPKTVETYLSRIYMKTNTRSRLELARLLDDTPRA